MKRLNLLSTIYHVYWGENSLIKDYRLDGHVLSDSYSIHEFNPGDESDDRYQGFEDSKDGIKELARTVSRTNQIGIANVSDWEDLIRYLSHMSQVPGISPYKGNIDPS